MKFLHKITGMFTRYLKRSPEIPKDESFTAFNGVDSQLPGELEKIVTQEEYAWILTQTIGHLSPSWKTFRLQEGILFYSHVEEPYECQLNFTNLVKYLVYEDKPEWPQKISVYLGRMKVDRTILDPMLDSFEAARGALTIRLHAQNASGDLPGEIDGFLTREIAGDLYAVLALDLPGQFHLLRRGDVEKWDIEPDELFWTAFANLGDKQERIKITRRPTDGFPLITLFDSDYAAAFAADFANHCSDWVGKLGSIVSIPTRGSVFIYPIDSPSSFNGAFSKIADLTNRFFIKDPGQLTNDIYWFHHNRFELFPKFMKGHTLSYNIPNRLIAYLKTPQFPSAPWSDLKDSVLTGNWEGFYEYGKGCGPELLGVKKAFQLKMTAKGGQVDGVSTDEGYEQALPVCGFVRKEMISFIKKSEPDAHFIGVYDPEDGSFTGTWEADSGQGKMCSGSWVMIKV